jgi:hypothetical protein
MKQVRIGDITIDAVIEREGPWRRPQDFFPAYDEATFKRHLPTMEPEVFDAALGMMVITYQTFVVRTPRHTILWTPAASSGSSWRQARAIRQLYSITSSARASMVGGTMSPIAFAVLRLIFRSNWVGN